MTLRQGIDWITGPEARFKRGIETGYFTSPRFYIGENAARGTATEIRFAGPEPVRGIRRAATRRASRRATTGTSG